MSKKAKSNKGTNMSDATATVPAPVATGKGKGKGSANPRVQHKDNGFRVLRTVEVHPSQVELVEKFRGRASLVNDETQVERAESMRVTGQQQAIQVREKPGEPGKFECIFGNTRKLGADKLVSGYTTLDKREIAPNPDFKLRCEVVDCDDEQSFLANVVENSQRTQCSPIDNAVNQEKLRTDYGMSDAAITRRYGYASQASVTNLKKLLTLPADVQAAIHDGSMTQAAGILFASKADEADYANVWLAAVDFSAGGEAIGSDAVKKAIEKVKKDKATAAATLTGDAPASGEGTPAPGEASGTPATGEAPASGTATAPENRFALTLKQFKDLVTAVASDEKCPAKVAEAMSIILTTITGETSDRDFVKWFAEHVS